MRIFVFCAIVLSIMGILDKLFGSDSARVLREIQPLVGKINALEAPISALSDEGLRGKTDEFKKRLAEGEILDQLLPEAFATVREASKRVSGQRHFDVQLIAGIALHEGKITEGHTRPLLMLSGHPEDQNQLYQNILTGSLSVREAERAARNIAREKARAFLDPETRALQERMESALGTRVHIEKRGPKGKIYIEFFSEEELKSISDKIVPAPASFI